jgi:very-short-patch-repair endonuclease|tara:strand:+ start:852 stop:1259 length:408 start_codon:yes stop_codon:yes gene_type:complete
MIFIGLNGAKKKLKTPTRYLIDWDAKSRSKIQRKVKLLLQPFWMYDIVFEEMPLVGSRMTFDFYNSNKRIALEVDGNQHYNYNKFFHAGSRQKFFQQIDRDDKKEVFCKTNDIKLIRIFEKEEINQTLLEKLELI